MLIRTACDESRSYYDLLADLDGAMIRRDAEIVARLESDARNRALRRDIAVALLREHERSHESV
jgi:hypothetical protein